MLVGGVFSVNVGVDLPPACQAILSCLTAKGYVVRQECSGAVFLSRGRDYVVVGHEIDSTSRLGGRYDGCIHTEALGRGKVADFSALAFP